LCLFLFLSFNVVRFLSFLFCFGVLFLFRHAVNWFLDVCVLNSASSCRGVNLCIDVRDFCW
jgi:hypothetical protein